MDRRPMRLFDTARQAVVDLDVGPTVRMYTCGITPYDATHLGHAATYVTYDILHRRLLDRGHDVQLVRNITDVDDDLLVRARRDGVNYLDLGFAQLRMFDEDLEQLGNLDPWSEPRATSAIPDIRGMIHALLDRGAAYEAEGAVYFSVASRPDFGAVSGYDESQMLEVGATRGERPDDPAKRHPLDSVLWQPSAPDEPAWDSPWGLGRPGWHIGCAALATRELGPQIDIHGGGCDLAYPHHEFCNAQVEAAVDGSTQIWMHQACVYLDGEPMSKSTGNLVFVRDLTTTIDPRAVRLSVMSLHYRVHHLEWRDELVDDAADRLDLWLEASPGSDEGLLETVREALDDDLDVPTAIHAIDDAAARAGGITDAAALLGITL